MPASGPVLTTPMKILLVHNAYREPGGEDVVVAKERRLLEEKGHVVIEYRRANGQFEHCSKWSKISLAAGTVWSSKARTDIASLLRKNRPHVVHVHNTFPLISPSIYGACQQAGTPVIQTLHNYRLLCPAGNLFRSGHVCQDCLEHNLLQSVRHGCYRNSRPATGPVAAMLWIHRLLKTWNRRIDFYISPSEHLKKKFVQAGFPAAKICVKPHFVDPDPGISATQGEYVLYVGRLSYEKGVRTLLEAWRRLRQQIPLFVVGDGPLREELATSGSLEQLPITVLGQIPNPDVIGVMKQARFLIFPSEQYESFGLAIIEAFSCGIPVLGSRRGTAQELVAEGRTGLLFDPGNAESLCKTVEWAWTHADYMTSLRQHARHEYEQKYSARRNYQILLDIYAAALANRRGIRHAHSTSRGQVLTAGQPHIVG